MRLTLAQIAEAVSGTLTGSPDITVTSVVTDTRKMQPNSLFVALKSKSGDGHDYVNDAFASGALCAIVSMPIQPSQGQAAIMVADTLKALGELSRFYKRMLNIPCTAITGSVGKTTTKEFVSCVLSEKYSVHKTDKNFNNAIGLPLTLLEASPESTMMVLEMGMNHFGEISYLSQIANPDIAVITNIGTSHIGNLGSREGILQAKLEILDGMSAEGGIILNGDEPLLYEKKDGLLVTAHYFGIDNAECPLRAENIRHDISHTAFDIVYQNEKIGTAQIPTVGKHNVYNALAAAYAGILTGIEYEKILAGLSKFKESPLRQNIYDSYGITYIEDCYNASPESMQAALTVLKDMPCANRKIAVLADMLELGDYSGEGHRTVGEAVSAAGCDLLYTYGTNSSELAEAAARAMGRDKCHHFATRDELITHFTDIPKSGDVVLFKASRGMKMEQVIQALNEYNSANAKI